MGREIAAGYKQTEVGVIPEDWKTHTIGDSMKLINGRAFKPSEWKDSGLPIIRIQNLNDSEAIFNYCSSNVEDRHRIEKGDLLFAWSGTKGTSFGARVWNGVTGVLNQHIFKVIPNQEKLTPEYAFLVLCKVQEHIEKQAHGFKASFVHVKKADLICINLPIPATKTEQTAITTALRDMDALISGLDKLITKKRLLKQGSMKELLTAKKRLAGFLGEWEVRKFPDVCWFQEGPGVRNSQFTKSGIKLLNGTNIEKGTLLLDKTNRYISKKEAFGCYSHFLADAGDIIIACSGITIEKFDEKVTTVQSEHLPLCMNTSTMRFKVAPILLNQFLLHFLKSRSFKEQIGNRATGSAQLNFGPSHVQNVHIMLPPTIEEQVAIAQILTDLDNEIEALEKRRTKTLSIKQGMMQELLTGKTRLI